MVDDVSKATYVGESARSARERMNEHVEDAHNTKVESHMRKHWANIHGGQEKVFKFEILGFFNSPLERQVAEAVRIARTGGEKILNSRGEYNRCKLPRIIALDDQEVRNLGDMEPGEEQAELREGDKSEDVLKDQKRSKKKEKFRDLMRWGKKRWFLKKKKF